MENRQNELILDGSSLFLRDECSRMRTVARKQVKFMEVFEMYYSYVMGIGDEINNLKNLGFNIEQFGENYGVSFPKEKAKYW